MVKKLKSLDEKSNSYNISAKKDHIALIDAHVERMGLQSRSSFLISTGLREVRRSAKHV